MPIHYPGHRRRGCVGATVIGVESTTTAGRIQEHFQPRAWSDVAADFEAARRRGLMSGVAV